MDIKEKFKTFIDKQKTHLKGHVTTSKSSEDIISQSDFEGRTAVIPVQDRELLLDEHKLTSEAEQAVIESIESLYFEISGDDTGDHELKKFSDVADLHVLTGIRSRLRKQQAVVNRRVSNLILQKQALCTKEMVELSNLQNEICKAINLCSSGRSHLRIGKLQFASSSLGILSNYRKRQNIANVIKSLETIRTLQMTEVELRLLLEAEDYPGAINLLLEGQNVANTFQHFACISELSNKLQDTIDIVEAQLDSAVSKVAVSFNPFLYNKLITAFDLLNKSQMMMDQLHMHLTSHIHNTAFNIILGYVELYNSAKTASGEEFGTSFTSYTKLQYNELCKYIYPESFLACFIDLSKGMWNILKNYRNIMKWHNENQYPFQEYMNFSSKSGDTSAKENYIKQKLEYGSVRLWQDVQAKLKTFILASDLSHFKFEDFLQILDVINILIDIGESFCGNQSETLHESVKKQSYNFFQQYHSSRLEELHMILENEGWEICPLKTSFQISQLIEYRFLKGECSSQRQTPFASPKKGGENVKQNLFDIFEEGSPFDLSKDESLEEDIMANEGAESAISEEEDSEDDLPDTLKMEFDGEKTVIYSNSISQKKKDLSKIPMITNTTLTILRLIGKYIQMMKLLRSIAFDVFVCLSQLFEYYMYSIFTLFTSKSFVSDSHVSPQLNTTLRRIEETLIFNPGQAEDSDAIQKVPCPIPCPQLLAETSENLFCLSARVVAVESLAYLSHQLETLQWQIESLIPSEKNTILQQFYSNTVMMVLEVRSNVYMSVASKILDYDTLLSQINSVKWDINDFKDCHNPYVDFLLKQLQMLVKRLDSFRCTYPLPLIAGKVLWENIFRVLHRVILEGLSNARKCSNEGRSLMQLDYQQYLMKAEAMTSIRPLPDRQLVDAYIKAYYLPESEIEEWISANRSTYSPKQLVALATVMSQVSKKTRQRISSTLLGGDNQQINR